MTEPTKEPIDTPQEPIEPQDPVEPIKDPAEPVDPAEPKEPAAEPKDGDDDATLLGKKKSDGEPKDNEPSEEGAPEGEYDLETLEGLELDKDMLEALTPVFKELDLSNKDVQALADAYSPLIKTSNDRAIEATKLEFEKTKKAWTKETLDEFGEKKVALANKAIDRLGSEELRDMLDITGLGSNKTFVSMMIKVGEMVGEDNLIEPAQGAPKGEGAKLNTMYPSMGQK